MDLSSLMVIVTTIEVFVTAHPLLVSVLACAGALLAFRVRPLIDWYSVKPKILRQQKAQLQFESYQKILDLLDGFFHDNAKTQYRLFHGDPVEKFRIFEEAQREGKDPLKAVADYIAPLNHPEDLMAEIGKCNKRLSDNELNPLISEWGEAFSDCDAVQREFRDKMSQKMTEEKWIKLFMSVRSSGDVECERRKRLMDYLRNKLR